uniref:Protein kinase domain-containing protein n=2 Tax=Moniliophthora roreri TaxID=221103 RepID=A0A0W0FVH7_MONRR
MTIVGITGDEAEALDGVIVLARRGNQAVWAQSILFAIAGAIHGKSSVAQEVSIINHSHSTNVIFARFRFLVSLLHLTMSLFSGAQYLTFNQCHFVAARDAFFGSSPKEEAYSTGNNMVQSIDFRKVPIGDIKLLHPVVDREELKIPAYGGLPALRRLKANNPFKLRLEGKTVKVIRTIQTACILSPTLASEKFTVVTYRSTDADTNDAILAWKRDYEHHSSIRHANVLQLFGVTSSSIHALIYYEEFMTMRRAFYEEYSDRRNDPFIYCYLAFKYVAIMEEVYHFAPEMFKGELRNSQWLYNPKTTSFSLSHINPKNYDVVPGNRGPYLVDQLGEGRLSSAVRVHEPPPVSFDDASMIIECVSRMVPDYLNSIAWIGLKEWGVQLKAQELIPFGTVTSKPCGQCAQNQSCILGRIPSSALEMPQWTFSMCQSIWPAQTRYNTDKHPGISAFVLAFDSGQRIEGDILLRFSLTSSFESRIRLRTSFLSQSFRFRHSCNPYPTDCLFIDYVQVMLSAQISLHPLPRPLFLFVHPVQPQTVDGTVCIPWPRHDAFFYWSFDPTGSRRLTDMECSSYGVPTLRLSVSVGTEWSIRHYRAVKEYLELKGYDPLDVKYSEECGYPIIDAVGLSPGGNNARTR